MEKEMRNSKGLTWTQWYESFVSIYNSPVTVTLEFKAINAWEDGKDPVRWAELRM